jgi:hypothetical protein
MVQVGRQFPLMGMGRWINVGCVLPQTMWKPCESCSWGVGPFWGLTNLSFILNTILAARDAIHIQQFVFRCGVYELVGTSFNSPSPHLYPPPTMGFSYWWSLDFISPLSLKVQHNRYVFIMTEHFSEWLDWCHC